MASSENGPRRRCGSAGGVDRKSTHVPRDEFVERVGLMLVVQNIAGSVFNSHLFDFMRGWLYVLGVAGGMLRNRKAATGSSRVGSLVRSP